MARGQSNIIGSANPLFGTRQSVKISSYTVQELEFINQFPDAEQFQRDGGKIEQKGSTIRFLRKGLLHRDNGPAHLIADQMEIWYQDGKKHRTDGPAKSTKTKKEWYLNDQKHRIGGPAVVKPKSQEWFVQGKLHREDGPAKIKNGISEWYFQGKRHRIGGPAVEGGYNEWWEHGKHHRLDGPALEDSKAYRWKQHGKLHRVDGPAVVYHDGRTEWWQEGIPFREGGLAHQEDLYGRKKWVKQVGHAVVLHKTDGPALIDPSTGEFWYQQGALHREDGPAAIKLNGTLEWYQEGVLHRAGGPAKINYDGSEEWWNHGKLIKSSAALPLQEHRVLGLLHNQKGPAVIAKGQMRWFENGLLHRTDGPAVIEQSGAHLEWHQDGKLHREDGPALVKGIRSQEWYQNGLLHRIDGPARLGKNKEVWALDGVEMSQAQHQAKISKRSGSFWSKIKV